MRLLLDTHIWIWSIGQKARLSSRVARELRKVENELWLSPISVWELIVLCEKNRLRFSGNLKEWVDQAFRSLPVHEAVVTHEIAMTLHGLNLPEQDPADRLLVATAKVLGLTLVTADDALQKTTECNVLANH